MTGTDRNYFCPDYKISKCIKNYLIFPFLSLTHSLPFSHNKTEGRCVDDAGTELCEKCFLYTVWLIGTKVVADDRLSALADSLKRKRDKLTDTGNDRHCPDSHITAESGKTAGKADRQKTFC